jgi:hypothetical protein
MPAAFETVADAPVEDMSRFASLVDLLAAIRIRALPACS